MERHQVTMECCQWKFSNYRRQVTKGGRSGWGGLSNEFGHGRDNINSSRQPWEEDNLVVSERENNEDKKGEEKAIYILRKMLK